MRVRSPEVLRQCSVVFWRTCRCNVFGLDDRKGNWQAISYKLGDVCVEYFVYE